VFELFLFIAVASDLARLLRDAKDQRDDDNPTKVVFSSHHALFFNVMCNELKKRRHKRYFLSRPNRGDLYMLRAKHKFDLREIVDKPIESTA